MTLWSRLEPHPRDGSLERSLQGQVRDPLWFLTRQWQTGELEGDDAGSPVQAVLEVQSVPLTGYAPDADGTALVPYDPLVPLEPHIERVPVTLNVRGSAQLGRYAEAAITAAVPVPATAAAVVAALRAAYPIAATAPADAPEDTAGRLVRASLAGRVVDGLALAAAYAIAQAGGTPVPPLPPQASDPSIRTVLADLVAYRAALYSEPSGDAAWQPRRLDYAATVVSATTDGTVTLTAPDFSGGGLDWQSFSFAADAGPAPATSAPAPPLPAPAVETFNFLPNHVTFRGMPPARYWQYEDAVSDFGAIAPAQTDLATMLVMEFALVFGNDWFYVPVPVGVGSLAKVTTLVVTDTFGIRTVIEPADDSAWSMFKLTGAAGRSRFLMVPPSCATTDDGAPLEDVYFLRDDMAAMAWAVEATVQGPLDAPVDAAQLAFAFDAAFPPPPPPAQTPGGPAQAYALEQIPPANWIPMVPVVSPTGARYFRRGILVRPGYGDVHAAARLLEPGQPFFVADECIPREGAEVTRYFRRTRWTDGSTVTWLAHRDGPGLGPSWSGLAFDLVRPLGSQQ
ncbi:MAG: hypothetical protein ACRDP7_33735 [Trebonia sp.]